MRTIKFTARFRRDYRREKSTRHGKKLDALLMQVLDLLANDTPSHCGILTILYPANGAIIATVTSGPILS